MCSSVERRFFLVTISSNWWVTIISSKDRMDASDELWLAIRQSSWFYSRPPDQLTKLATSASAANSCNVILNLVILISSKGGHTLHWSTSYLQSFSPPSLTITASQTEWSQRGSNVVSWTGFSELFRWQSAFGLCVTSQLDSGCRYVCHNAR